MGKGPTLLVSSRLKATIDFLHKEVKRNTEWCGILIWKDLTPERMPKDKILQGINIRPMEIGSSSYTEGEYSKYINMELMPFGWKMFQTNVGFCHSHHSMGTGPSGTDNNDVIDTTPFFGKTGYLSLIVNYAGSYSCRFAFLVQHLTGGVAVDSFIGAYDVNIQFDFSGNVDECVKEVFKTIKKAPAANTYYGTGQSTVGYRGHGKGKGKNGWNNRPIIITERPGFPKEDDMISSDEYMEQLRKESDPNAIRRANQNYFDDFDKDYKQGRLFPKKDTKASNPIDDVADMLAAFKGGKMKETEVVEIEIEDPGAEERGPVFTGKDGNIYTIVDEENPLGEYIKPAEVGDNVYTDEYGVID